MQVCEENLRVLLFFWETIWINVRAFPVTDLAHHISQSYLSFVWVGDPNFNKPRTVFACNARSIALVAKVSC